jgi:Tfp pilus assembly protein PilN
LTPDERENLEIRAGALPVSTYVKRQLFNDQRRAATQFRKASPDRTLLAQLLATLGGSRLAPNLRALADEAEVGSLAADEETVGRLMQACDDVRLMHNALMRALGLEEKPPSRHEIDASAEFNEAAEDFEDRQ